MRILLWGVLLIGPLFIFTGIRANYRDRPSLQWPTTTGTVVQSEWRFRGGKNSYYYVDMTYAYLVNDRRYMGHKIKLWDPKLSGDRDPVKAFVADYHLRAVVDVHYDPQHPENAVLFAGADESANRMMIWGGGIISVLATWLMFRGQPHLARLIAEQKAEEARAQKVKSEAVIGLAHAFATYEPDCKRKLNCFPNKECLLDALGHDGDGIQDWKPEDRVIDSTGHEYRLIPQKGTKRYDIEPTGQAWSCDKLLDVAVADARLLKRDPDALRRRVGDVPAEKKMAVLMKCIDDLPVGPKWTIISLIAFLIFFFFAVMFGAYKLITWIQK